MKSYPQQLHIFFNALTFFTRIPAPSWVDYSEQNQKLAISYFTWIGLVVGLLSAIVFWLTQHILPVEIAIIASMLTSIFLTGGLHEDGLADSCDGFGGGWSPQQIAKIMKDSRIGSYGVLGLVLALLLKFSALNNITIVSLALIVGHTISRFPALLIMSRLNYVGSDQNSKSEGLINKLGSKEYLIAFAPIALVFSISPFIYLSVIIPLLFLSIGLTAYFKKHLAGYNGDCLGASQQSAEITIYLWLCLPFLAMA